MRSILIALLMVSSLFSSIPIASANSSSGIITTFADGNETVILQTDYTLTSTQNLTLQRNTTIGDASFDIVYDVDDPSPGALTIDVGSDGQYEWHLGGNGDGQLGEQFEFSSGTTSTTISANGNRTWLHSGSWRLPADAQVASSNITVGFTPNLDAQFSEVGNFSDLQVGDMDGDGIEEPIFLVQDHIAANGTTSPHIGWMKWNGTGLVVSWISTCADAEALIVGDSDGDNRADILTVASSQNQLCQHISGSSWLYSTNVSMNLNFQDAVLGDLDGDSQDDLISIDADGTLGFRSYSGGVYSPPVTTLVPTGNSFTFGSSDTFRHVDIGTFYGTNLTVVVGEEDENGLTAYNTLWNWTANNWNPVIEQFQCSSGPFEIIDWSTDGFDDLIGLTPDSRPCTATWNGSAWSTKISDLSPLFNFTVGDHDGDGDVDLFVPVEGFDDGSDSTQTGSVEMYRIYGNGSTDTSSFATFTPHTSPRAIAFVDMDGDGLSEQIIGAGEATRGLFVGAWHILEWDLEGDGILEMAMSGYANSSNPLSLSDQEDILVANINTELSQSGGFHDNYDTHWKVISPVARSTGAGTISQSSLSMTYGVTFTAEANPTNGNLSNSLNRFMLMGTGGFDVPIDLTSTRNGTVTLDTLSISWIEGASFIQIPDPPVLQISSYNHSQVNLVWTSSTSQQDLIGYELFRLQSGTTLNPTLDLYAELFFNELAYNDTEVTSNDEWEYAIRSMHANGIYSNFSNFVSILIPEEIDTTPPDAPLVSLFDVPNDDGSVLNLSFIPSPSSDLAYTLIFFENSDFTNASGLTPYANISSDEDTTSMLISGLTDGDQHWAAAVAVDHDDNAWWNVTTIGPAYSFNNTIRQSTLTLDVLGNGTYDDGVRNGIHVHAGAPFSISALLSSEGTPLSDEELTLTIKFSEDYTWMNTLTTGPTGIASQTWNDWSDFVTSGNQSIMFVGVGVVNITWAGGTFGDTQQSVQANSVDTVIVSTVHGVFSTLSESIQLDSNGQGTITASAIADDSSDQYWIEQIVANWQLGNGTEILGDSGLSYFDSNGITSIQINYITGGWIDINLTTPWWISLSPDSIRVDLHPPPVEGCTDSTANNYNPNAEIDNDSCTYNNPQLITLEVSCDTDWQILDNSTQTMADIDAYSLECSMLNPNPVMVNADIDIQENSFFESDLSMSEVSIPAGGTLVITLSPVGWSEDTDLQNGSIRFDVSLSATDWDGVDDHWIVPYVFTPAEMIDDSNNNGDNTQGTSDEESGETNLTLIIACVVIVLGLLGFVGLRMVMRKEEDDDAETFEDEEWKPKGKKKIQTQPDLEHMPTGRSLDELTTRGSSVSMKRSKRVDRRAGVRPTDIVEIQAEEEAHEIEEESEWDYTQDEDYHIDDEGVEWWKDEVGQWWYKYPDEEDWEAFEE